MAINDDNNTNFQRPTLPKAVWHLDANSIYRMQFNFLCKINSAQIGDQPKEELYKEWLEIIVDNGTPKTKNFEEVTFRAFNELLSLRSKQEECSAARSGDSQEESLPSRKEIRLAEAKAIAPRVLFDQEGNLKPGGVLTKPSIEPAYKSFKSDMAERVGTVRPVAEEVFAKNFIDSVLDDESHALHDTLRESILRAAKKLPPLKENRAASSLRDKVLACESTTAAEGASR